MLNLPPKIAFVERCVIIISRPSFSVNSLNERLVEYKNKKSRSCD